jgi:DNA-binding Lrp family transcriptional regulator
MELKERDLAVVGALCGGLALTPRPYLELAQATGMDEDDVIERIKALAEAGIIRRMGVIVRHHELGYRANAMVVWDIPDAEVESAGRRLGACPEVTLCYRRPRRLPQWPYNLFTMVHGRDRAEVITAIAAIAAREGLAHHSRETLFSTRRFKQCGARYGQRLAAE